MRLTFLSFTLIIVHAVAATARAAVPNPLSCEFVLIGTWPFGVEVGSLFARGRLQGPDLAGLVGLSRNEFARLLTHGEVESATGYAFRPYVTQPNVWRHLREDVRRSCGTPSAAEQARAAADDAWEQSVIDVIHERIAARRAYPGLAEWQMRRLAGYLRPKGPGEPEFDVPREDVLEIPEAIDLEGEPALVVRARMTRGLSRRLNLGQDQADLKYWSGLRALAAALGVTWRTEAPGPALEDALHAFFRELPREAGVVVSVHDHALDRLTWSPARGPVYTRLELSDLVGIDSRGADEYLLLQNLAPRR